MCSSPFLSVWQVGWAAQGYFREVLEDGEGILEVSKKCARNHLLYPSTHVSVSCAGLPAAVLEPDGEELLRWGGAINSGLALSPLHLPGIPGIPVFAKVF